MNAAAEKSSIGFEENKMTILRDGANQVRNAGMMQRFASPDPNDRRAAANDIADFFVRNRMAGIGMQNFRRIHELNGAGGLPETQFQFVDAAEILHPDSSHPVSHEKIRDIIGSRSPVVWIRGSEPLYHPGIAHLVRAITQNGHFVFLETDGALLRRRIHEFQPVSRLFLTVRLESGA